MAFFQLSCLFFVLSLLPSYLGAPSPKNIFILAGQSNMAGRGGVERAPSNKYNFVWDGYIPPESQPNPSILRLNPNYQWEEAHEPLHKGIDINRTVGIGPGMPFAHQLLAKASQRVGSIGLVPSARGGSLIQYWRKGAQFYNDLISRIKASDKEGGTVRVLFWLQGESDASDNATALAYKANLGQFFTDLRHDIQSRFLPIILVKIASYDTYMKHDHPNMAAVRAAEDAVHLELPDVQIIDVLQFVKRNGDGFNKDHVHLNVNTQVALGKLLADTYLFYYGKLL